MMDHEAIRQAIAAQALDALDDVERASVEHELLQHIAGCDECLTLFRDLREIAGDLALASGSREVSEELESRVLAAVREIPSQSDDRVSPRRRLVVRVAAVAAIVALVASWSLSAVLVRRTHQNDARTAATSAL